MPEKKNRGYFAPYVDYQIGKQTGFNPFNPYGYFTQAGIAARQQEERKAAEKKKQEAQWSAPTPAPMARAYQPDPLEFSSTPTYSSPSYSASTYSSYSSPSYSTSGYYNERPKSWWPRVFHAWWWRETRLFSAWEDLGDGMAGADWPLKLLCAFVTALVFGWLTVAWPWASMELQAVFAAYTLWIAAAAGAVVGFVLPPVVGRIVLLVRAVLVFAIVVTLRATVITAAVAAVYAGYILIFAHR